MKKVKTLILRTAGTNCDMETAYAFKKAGSDVSLIHINSLIRAKNDLLKSHILALPGGFSYGDDIASGKILANELKHTLKKELTRFIKSGKLIIGICNGFQILVKMGLLPNTSKKSDPGIEATLGLNNSGKFEDRWIYLKKDTPAKGKNPKNLCIWTTNLPDIIYLPVAHGEGKFIPANKTILKKLVNSGQVIFRYSAKDGKSADYPDNPNGSIDNIAGICDPTGRIFGLMPHPERHIEHTQHPRWQREGLTPDKGVGLQIFKNGVNFVRNTLL